MIIVLKPNAPSQVADDILAQIESKGLRSLHMPGSERVVLGALGDERVLLELQLESHPHVERVEPILAPFKLASRELHPHDTIVHLGAVPVGGEHFTVIAGPCAVESYSQMEHTAVAVQKSGAQALRGGVYKPRTSPYSFQGLGTAGLEILESVGQQLQMPVVTEIVDVEDIERIEKHASCFQIGARNMQNFQLLKAVGRRTTPVLLKRGMAAKVEDLLMAAEYILSEGNPNVILCERGIRTFETATRNTLDLNAIPYIRQHSHLPILVDPSHGTGVRDFVIPMAKAATACGADGLIIEVHEDPQVARSDGMQSLDPSQFEQLMQELEPIVHACGRRFA